MGNYTARRNRENAQAEIIGAIMEYREERLSFDDLFMFLQSFDKEVTVDGVKDILGRSYYG